MREPYTWLVARCDAISWKYTILGVTQEFDAACDAARTLQSDLNAGYIYILEMRAVCVRGEILPVER